MEKIKILFKLVLVSILGLIICAFVKYGTEASTSTSTIGVNSSNYLYVGSKKGTTFNLARLLKIYTDILDLSLSDLSSLYGSKIEFGSSSYTINGTTYSNSQISVANAMCLAHWNSTRYSESYWYLRQIMTFYYNGSSYVLQNYTSSGNPQTINSSSNASAYQYACELGRALYSMYTSSSTKNTSTENTVVGKYLARALVNGYFNFQTCFSNINENYSTAESTDTTAVNTIQSTCNSYYTSIKSYKAVTASWYSTDTDSRITESGDYTLIGPINVSFKGQKIKSISISRIQWNDMVEILVREYLVQYIINTDSCCKFRYTNDNLKDCNR